MVWFPFANNVSDIDYSKIHKRIEKREKRKYKERKGKHIVCLEAISKDGIWRMGNRGYAKEPLCIEDYITYDEEDLRNCLINLAKAVGYTRIIDRDYNNYSQEYEIYRKRFGSPSVLCIGKKGLVGCDFFIASDNEIKHAVMDRSSFYMARGYAGVLEGYE